VSPRAAAGSWQDTRQDTRAIFTHYGLHWATAAAFLGAYICIMLFVTVPSYEWTRDAHWDDPVCVFDTGEHNKTAQQQQVRNLASIDNWSMLGQLQPFLAVYPQNAWANSNFLGQPNAFLAAGLHE
jgi:hypothetical protein